MADLYSQLLYNNGEGIVHTDLNNDNKQMLARMNDQYLARQLGYLATAAIDPEIGSEAGNDPGLTTLAYVYDGGDCVPKQGTSGTKVTLNPGTLLQKIGNATGSEAQLLAYTVASGEIDLTIAAGGGVNPRVDLIQMKLEWENASLESRDIEDATTRVVTSQPVSKKRRVAATFSIKQGTAGATPSFPTPDSGYVAVAAIYVGATWTTGIGPHISSSTTIATTSAYVLPLAVPIGISSEFSWPDEADLFFAANFSRSTDGAIIASGAGTGLRFWCPQASMKKRIVGVSLYGDGLGATNTISLRNAIYIAGGGLGTVHNRTLGTNITGVHNFWHMGHISDASVLSNPSAANGPIGEPVWACGGISGPAQRFNQNVIAEGAVYRAFLNIDAATGAKILGVRWYFAG